MLSVEDLLDDVIASLSETGELDNTYIFFTSDNGYHLGQHRMTQGKRTAY
jgi:N-acetylglucosamine-6-sulfatase